MRTECGKRDACRGRWDCVIASIPLGQVMEQLQCQNWPIVEGPIIRIGATQTIRSVYARDANLYLIDISEFA
jgi:hypothetical protein